MPPDVKTESSLNASNTKQKNSYHEPRSLNRAGVGSLSLWRCLLLLLLLMVAVANPRRGAPGRGPEYRVGSQNDILKRIRTNLSVAMGALLCCASGGDGIKDISFFSLGSLRLSSRGQRKCFQTKITDLPDCILLQIFSHLNFLDLCIVGLVCRKWYVLSRDFTLHRQVDLSSLELTPKQLELLLHNETMPSIVNLRVFGSHSCLWLKNISPRALAKISKRCPRLRCLKIENFSFRCSSKDKCVRLMDFPSTLEMLSLRGSIIGRCAFFKIKSEHAIALDHLKILDIGRCFFVADAEVKPFIRLPQLEELYLEGCPFIDTEQYLTDLLIKCPQLTLLDVEGTYIVDHAFAIISRHCQYLKYLFIGCTSLNDTVVLTLPERNFLYLSSLCIIQTAISDEGLAYLIQILPSLKHIRCDKRYISAHAINAVQDRQTHLRIEISSLNVHSATFRHEGCGHFTMDRV